jgi:polar amino acid transport system permease protein
MIRNFEVVLSKWPMYLTGLFNTIWLCAVAAALSLLLATMLTVVMMHNHVVVRKTAQAAVDSIRCIPFLMLAYLTYYCLPTVGVRLSHWTVGLLTLVVYNTAYFAEILRGAWAHLPHEQEEAGRAFGYTRTKLFVRIIAPQVFLAAAPVLGNQTIILIKDSAFLMVITVPELTYMANHIQSTYFVVFETFAAAILLYWLLCTIVEAGVRRLEQVAAVRRDV